MDRPGLAFLTILSLTATGACDDGGFDGAERDAGDPSGDGAQDSEDAQGAAQDMDVWEGEVPAQICPSVTPRAASLPGGFRVLFRKEIMPASGQFNGTVVATRDRLAIADRYALHILDRQGNELTLFNQFVSGRMSAPVADADGNIYVVASGFIHAFDAGGKVTWWCCRCAMLLVFRCWTRAPGPSASPSAPSGEGGRSPTASLLDTASCGGTSCSTEVASPQACSIRQASQCSLCRFPPAMITASRPATSTSMAG
jgi:hypothetical protein